MKDFKNYFEILFLIKTGNMVYQQAIKKILNLILVKRG